MVKNGFYVTNRGRALIAGLMAGDTFEISKVMVGSGRPETLTALAEMTDLVSPVAAATSTNPLRKGDTVEMIIEYRSDLNGGLETGFWLNEFAVYAMDGDTEVMIYYGCLGDYPQWVSAYTDGAVDIRRYPVSLKVSSDVQVEISYPSIAFLTAEDCTQYISAHNSDSESHPEIRSKYDRLLGEMDTLSGEGEPDSATAGLVGQKYEDTVSGDTYTCTAVTPGESGATPHYLWVPGKLGTLAEIRTAYSNIRGRLTGRNLLDNSWWALEEAIVNQRGQTEYSSPGYGIDRWAIDNQGGSAKLSILENCIRYQKLTSQSAMALYQVIDSPLWLAGKVITASILRRGTGNMGMLIHTDKGNFGSPSFGPSEKWVLNTYTLTLPTDISRVSFYTYPSTGSNLNYTDYMAAKLEPGPVQTLAHKDAAGDWVLNDPPPDPVFEQLKCQRYQVFGPVESAHLTHAGNISIAILPLPARLRSMPTIVGNPTVWAVDGNAEIKNVTITPDYVLNNGILLRITGSEVPCYVSFKAGDGLDANL